MNEAVYTPQPLPLPGDKIVRELIHKYTGPASCNMEIVLDIDLKLAAGEKKYGSPLMTHNGRSADLDAYQDIIDTIVYSIQGYYEETREFRKAARLLEINSLLRNARSIRDRLVHDGILTRYE